jgi:hypothetical protein
VGTLAWYNDNVSFDDDFSKFRLLYGDVASIHNCWVEGHQDQIQNADQAWELKGGRGIRPSDKVIAKADCLNRQISISRECFKKLKGRLSGDGVEVSISRTQLQSLGAALNHIRSCIYVNIDWSDNDGSPYTHRMVNLVSTASSSLIEIRPTLSYIELFSKKDWDVLINEGVIGWQIGQPTFRLEFFDEYPLLWEKLIEHFISVKEFVVAGGRFVVGGQSVIEMTLYEDMLQISDLEVWHGQRPVPLEGGGHGEIDLQLRYGDIKYAFEIQGPEHYGDGFNANNPEGFINRVSIDRQKVKWCMENDRMFVWADWETLREFLIMDGPMLRDYESRRRVLRSLLKQLGAYHSDGNRFVALFGTNNPNRYAALAGRKEQFEKHYSDLEPMLLEVFENQ